MRRALAGITIVIADLPPGATVLNVGCGCGVLISRYLVEKVNVGSVVIDLTGRGSNAGQGGLTAAEEIILRC